MSRPPTEIESEIAALTALWPVGEFAAQTQRQILLAIEELEYSIDDPDEFDAAERDVINKARRWKEGDSNDKPSEGWDDLCA